MFRLCSCHAALVVAVAWLSLVAGRMVPGAEPPLPGEIRVFVVKYSPVRGARIDQSVTGDWGAPLDETRQKTSRLTKEVIDALQEGSRYHGYKDPRARPALSYRVVGEVEFLEPLPTVARPGHRVPLTDYRKVVERVNIRSLVETQQVKEVWLWGYHGGVVDIWESNMASPVGDISNSDRDPHDLPVLGSTYTVYHYNYQRGPSEATENHMHQFEAVWNWVDGRDRTPPDRWGELLFWGKFVGSDGTHKIIRPGCGWSHYPPNAQGDYDWANKRFVETDIEDWRPDGTGRRQRMNCERWQGDSLRWFVYWMQNIPGAENGLTYQGRPLTNWWRFIGDFDNSVKQRVRLVQ
jgi:hypothetical protein